MCDGDARDIPREFGVCLVPGGVDRRLCEYAGKRGQPWDQGLGVQGWWSGCVVNQAWVLGSRLDRGIPCSAWGGVGSNGQVQ